MHPNPRSTVSAYLAKPRLRARRKPRWDGFRTQMMQLHRYNPRLASRTCVALLIWGAFAWTVHTIAETYSHPHKSTQAATHARTTGPIANASLASITHIASLPGGPDGALLPPGTLAVDRTYPNSYTWGNCTWYVAGRRQIPPRWGNAVSWYYNAVESGWKVGTTPAVGAVAWTSAGWSGHVALVEQVSSDSRLVYISEMNFRGLGVKSFRWVSASAFKYIY